jgi:serine/threonine-protein kinase HipA
MNLVVKKLNVYYRQRLVGFLAETPDQRFAFQYDESWIKQGFSISPWTS